MSITELLKRIQYELTTLHGLTAYDTAAPLTPENAMVLEFTEIQTEITKELSVLNRESCELDEVCKETTHSSEPSTAKSGGNFYLLQDLHDSEINWDLNSFWDSCFQWKLGDPLNEYQEEGVEDSIEDAITALCAAAMLKYPNSVFAIKIMGERK